VLDEAGNVDGRVANMRASYSEPLTIGDQYSVAMLDRVLEASQNFRGVEDDDIARGRVGRRSDD
jgi:hypothetical protein